MAMDQEEVEEVKDSLTQEQLKRALHYNPDTGEFTWVMPFSRKIAPGSRAGCKNSEGYIIIGVNGKRYHAHRLAWLYMEGYFPEHQIDHKKGIRDDNRWSQISHATHACNMQNTKISKNNTSGFPGVYRNDTKGRWRASISIGGKTLFCGLYENALDAALARFAVEQQCSKWTCNHRSELARAIKATWSEFNF